jgi:zinc transporter
MSGFAYRVDGGSTTEVALKQAPGMAGSLVWIHLNSNDAEAQAWLTEHAALPRFVVDALTATETRPRCDAAGDGALINLRGLSSEALGTADPLASVRIHAGKGRVISVTRKHLTAIDPVRRLVESGDIDDPGDLIAALASAITEELDPVVADLGDSLDTCEETLEATAAFDLRRNVNHVRAQAIGYRRFLQPQHAALDKLAALPADWLAEDDRLHLSSAADRAARMAEEVESIRERAALIHETLTDLRAELIDERSLVIAVVAMVFLPLTFITGLLGMNVAGIPYAQEPWAFWGVVAVCGVIAAVIAGYFIARHWIGR